MKLTVLLDNICTVLPREKLAQTLRAAFGTRLRCIGNRGISSYTDIQDAAYGWLAQSYGLKSAAALAALLASRGKAQPGLNYYEVSPCHWALARDHAILTPVQALTSQQAEELIATANAALTASNNPDCLKLDEYGWCLETVFDLPGPSFVSALHHPTNLGHPDEAAGRQARRLLNLIQMVWHEHPVNKARQLQGQLAINALWLHGGAVPELASSHQVFDCIIDTRHRAHLLAKVLQEPLCSSLNPHPAEALFWLDAGRDILSFSDDTAKDQLALQINQLTAIVQTLPVGTQVSVLNCQANQLQRIEAQIIQPSWYWRLRDTFLPQTDAVESLLMTSMLAP